MDGQLVELPVKLPCSKFLNNGEKCGKETAYGVRFETRRGDYLIFPYCVEHLPPNLSSRNTLHHGKGGKGKSRKK